MIQFLAILMGVSSALICLSGRRFLDKCMCLLTFTFILLFGMNVTNNLFLIIFAAAFTTALMFVFRKFLEFVLIFLTSFALGVFSATIAFNAFSPEMILLLGFFLGIAIFIGMYKVRNIIFILTTSFIGANGIASSVVLFNSNLTESNLNIETFEELINLFIKVDKTHIIITTVCFIIGVVIQYLTTNKNKKSLSK